LISDKITMRRYMVLTFTKYTTIMIAELMVMSGLGSSQDIMVWVWLVYVLHV
jgi:nitrate/nitrite transporter NarK